MHNVRPYVYSRPCVRLSNKVSCIFYGHSIEYSMYIDWNFICQKTFGTLDIDICTSHCFLLSYTRIVMAAEGDQLSVTENVAGFNISMPSADSESYLKDDLMCIKCRDPGSRNEEIQEVQRVLKTLINYA